MRKGKNIIKEPTSTFYRIKCRDCGNEQIVFSHSSMVIKCNVCGKELVLPTGGKARIVGADVIEDLTKKKASG